MTFLEVANHETEPPAPAWRATTLTPSPAWSRGRDGRARQRARARHMRSRRRARTRGGRPGRPCLLQLPVRLRVRCAGIHHGLLPALRRRSGLVDARWLIPRSCAQPYRHDEGPEIARGAFVRCRALGLSVLPVYRALTANTGW